MSDKIFAFTYGDQQAFGRHKPTNDPLKQSDLHEPQG